MTKINDSFSKVKYKSFQLYFFFKKLTPSYFASLLGIYLKYVTFFCFYFDYNNVWLAKKAYFTCKKEFVCKWDVAIMWNFLHILSRYNNSWQKQPPEVKKDVFRNFAVFTEKHQLCQRLFFNKVAGLRPATSLEKSLWHKCFPVNFAKFLRTLFFTEHLRWLLLSW